MKLYVGIDVSEAFSHVCIVDETGEVICEHRVETDPQSLIEVLAAAPGDIHRIGLEASPLAMWLLTELRGAGWPVSCLETRHLSAVLKTLRNKTDKNDARCIAQVVRTGWYSCVHVKSAESQSLRVLLSARKSAQSKAIETENEIRGLLKTFGLRVGPVTVGRFDGRVRELLRDRPALQVAIFTMLDIRAALRRAFQSLDGQVRQRIRNNPVAKRLMRVPGVGPVVAATFMAAVDLPERFSRSRTVAAHLGLTPRRYSSGEIDYGGRISKCGDAAVRAMLFEAANVLLTRTKRWCSLKAWGIGIAKRSGLKRARVAVARKLAVLLHRIWIDGTTFDYQAG